MTGEGIVKAQAELAYMYQRGEGTEQSYEKAAIWAKKAAAAGDASAQNLLGALQFEGWGVKKDWGASAVSSMSAAIQGNAAAQYNMAVSYLKADPPDYANHIKWLQRSATQGYPKALNLLGVAYSRGLGVLENKQEAFRLYHDAAKAGDAQAQYNVGLYCLQGITVQKDPSVAIQWFRLAANQGHRIAQYQIGVMYEDGLGTARNPQEAAKWYRLVALTGYLPAERALGVMSFNARDYASAVTWLRRAATKGDALCQCMLGELYHYGRGVPKDRTEAIGWLLQAYRQGSLRAKQDLIALGVNA